mmetsp:Transcript_66971/g.217980  ORF Transcript_66971/g.217980 Transcript_66971/m.217980 type:complete len:230 (-) Transcript_66971:63-752(-)
MSTSHSSGTAASATPPPQPPPVSPPQPQSSAEGGCTEATQLSAGPAEVDQSPEGSSANPAAPLLQSAPSSAASPQSCSSTSATPTASSSQAFAPRTHAGDAAGACPQRASTAEEGGPRAQAFLEVGGACCVCARANTALGPEVGSPAGGASARPPPRLASLRFVPLPQAGALDEEEVPLPAVTCWNSFRLSVVPDFLPPLPRPRPRPPEAPDEAAAPPPEPSTPPLVAF